MVSVGLPVYNGERYLEAAIRSILDQTYEDLELIIQDNASTDGTAEICRRLAAEDPRIRYERNDENLGAARNYNLTLDRAQGRYFKWFAHDDLCEPDFIRVCVEALDSDPDIVLAYPTPVDIDESGGVIGPQDADLGLDDDDPVDRFRDAMGQVHGCLPVFGLIRSDVLRRTGKHGNYPSADRVLVAELTLWGKLTEVPKPLFLHREHPERFVHTHTTPEERAKWFDPSRSSGYVFTLWRELGEYHAAIRRAPISYGKRLGAEVCLVRWTVRNWRNLAGEVKAAMLARTGRRAP